MNDLDAMRDRFNRYASGDQLAASDAARECWERLRLLEDVIPALHDVMREGARYRLSPFDMRQEALLAVCTRLVNITDLCGKLLLERQAPWMKEGGT